MPEPSANSLGSGPLGLGRQQPPEEAARTANQRGDFLRAIKLNITVSP